MATVLHSLTDVELLRKGRTSPLMSSPLFAELMDRFEVYSERELLAELHAQQQQRYYAPVLILRESAQEDAA